MKYKVGTKLNYLTILKRLENEPLKVLCLCECGKKKKFYLSNIVPKKNCRYTVSCGCKRGKLVSKKVSTHGMSKTKFYKRWRSMFDRCSPKYICANSYVGINVHKRWYRFEKFKQDMFQSYLNHRKKFGEKQTTLDRINVYGGYSKSNCRWATISEQAANKKTSKKYE